MTNKTAIAALLLLFAACAPVRKETGANVASLDNFGSKITRNSCGDTDQTLRTLPQDLRAVVSGADTEDLEDAAARVLAVTPDPVLHAFVRAGGKIIVQKDAALQTCNQLNLPPAQAQLKAEGTASFDACWYVDKDAKKKPPRIAIEANADTIRHGLLRMLAYVYAEHVLPRFEEMAMNGKMAKNASFVATFKNYAQQRALMKSAFLRDIERNNAKGLARLTTLAGNDAAGFANATVAEAIDSFYCSTTTSRVFESVYTDTHAAFTGLASQLGPVKFAGD